MWCCGTDVLKENGKYRKSVFDKKEIDSLKRKFNYVSGNQQFITRETFKKNIGYLGIRSVSSFLDRMFNSFDIDEDNKISFQDFIEYMEILKDGTDDQKAQISFNLIYMEIDEQKKDRKKLQNKSHESSFQLKNDKKKKKKKIIDMLMFEKFFQDFYKSWSSITNESIPKETKIALKQFINELFKKVEADGRKAIDLQYYKMLYKDRQFMLAFRQINSKLGNFFIKSNNTEYQKNVTLFHKILKKIITLSQKVFPLLNRAFIEDIQKTKMKSTNESPSQFRKFNETDEFNEDNIEKYFYDARRYEIDNIYEAKSEVKPMNQRQENKFNDVKINTRNISSVNEEFVFSPSTYSIPKQSQGNQQRVNSQNFAQHQQRTIYQSKLEDHVAFLQRKLIYLENTLMQIINETKQIYNQMHQEFIKIFQRIQKEQYQKQSEMRQYSSERGHNYDEDSPQLRENQNSKEKQISRSEQKTRKDDKKVFFGDKNFNLVLQIMVGIQMSVRSVSGFQEIIFEQPEDFDLKHTFQMDYGHFGQTDILYTFTDYAPNVFNHIRKIYGIGNEEYINSIGPNKMMSSLIMGKMASFQELVSEGKSGSFFYHTEDGKYLIKTISQRQFYFMRKILQEYFKHIKSNSQTLMPRIFGLHKITETTKNNYKKDNRMTYYLLVMNNFFNTKEKITDRYDLKGSQVGRQNTTGRGVKKDLNFLKDKRSVDIGIDQKIQLYQIIEKDAQFFARNQIIDYSLLLGCVKSGDQKRTRLYRAHSLLQLWTDQPSQQGRQRKQSSPHILQEKQSMNFKFKSQSNGSESYLFGIIDILTEYDSLKKTEHLFKSCIYDSKRISAVPPQFYKERFLDFLKYDVFKLADKRIKLPISPRKSPLAKKGSQSSEKQKSKSKSKSKGQKKSQKNNGFQQVYYSENRGNQPRKQTYG